MDAGLVGGIVGGTLGLLGGIIGTYASINKTESPGERAFMIRASIVAWVGIIIFLALLLTLPQPYNYFMWAVYGVLFPLWIIKVNKGMAAIRQQEGRADDAAT